MTLRGKTLQIFIPESDASGIKVVDANTSIVKGIYIPRSHFHKGLERKELKQPGVYFLFSLQNDSGKQEVYIGESEVLEKRLKQHHSGKDFWDKAVCFVSDKNNLTKAHIKFLEHYCYKICKENKINLYGPTPTQSSLDEGNTEFALSFFDDMKSILGVLGFSLLESKEQDKSNKLICKGKGITAYGYYNSGTLSVLKGSQARGGKETPASLGTWVSSLRSILIQKEILTSIDGYYVFNKDYEFSSVSAAAVVILGRQANGRTERKNEDGKTIDEIIRKAN